MASLESVFAESDQTEQGARDRTTKALRAEMDRLQTRIDTMYMDRLDGRISAAYFDEKSAEWHERRRQIEQQLQQMQATRLGTATEALQAMRAASDACAEFAQKQPQQQRALVSSVMQQATWKAGKFELTLKSPYQILANSNSVSRSKEREKPGSGQEIEIWLPVVDTFRALAALPPFLELGIRQRGAPVKC